MTGHRVLSSSQAHLVARGRREHQRRARALVQHLVEPGHDLARLLDGGDERDQGPLEAHVGELDEQGVAHRLGADAGAVGEEEDRHHVARRTVVVQADLLAERCRGRTIMRQMPPVVPIGVRHDAHPFRVKVSRIGHRILLAGHARAQRALPPDTEVVSMYSMRQRLAAELFGTFWLVLGGCGTAVLASYDVKFLGVAFAFGLTVADDGLRGGPHLGRPLQPGDHDRAGDRPPLRLARGAGVRRHPDRRRHRGRRRAAGDREGRQGRVRRRARAASRPTGTATARPAATRSSPSSSSRSC